MTDPENAALFSQICDRLREIVGDQKEYVASRDKVLIIANFCRKDFTESGERGLKEAMMKFAPKGTRAYVKRSGTIEEVKVNATFKFGKPTRVGLKPTLEERFANQNTYLVHECTIKTPDYLKQNPYRAVARMEAHNQTGVAIFRDSKGVIPGVHIHLELSR